ncbi:CHAT domain-containing protein [Chitinophaga sp. SYP-B3965]|uniref:CHAT domain-containing protein n=1 Tax=Chitinophaga sp. SYP-B3965 TaxID=2663120 RepID=UPI001299CF83|nr:CHAT domain-containing protein [Chitinophaga sp. SYP-B3965]MRG45839.1 CHAT domain-containing protein [Chitinophaga sp. SYP-B3965]
MKINKVLIRGELQPRTPGAQTTVSTYSTNSSAELLELSINSDLILEFVLADKTAWRCGQSDLDMLFPLVVADPFEIPSKMEPYGIKIESPIQFINIYQETADDSRGLNLKNRQTATTAAAATSRNTLQVSIMQGDLRFASYPLLAGHFQGDGILYAENEIDKALRGALREKHNLGIYPGEIGTTEIIISPQTTFAGAIIVGLGKPETLTAFQLANTVERGIAKYLIDLKRELFNPGNNFDGPIGISSLIIGCGYGGLTVENAISGIILGIQYANEKIHKLFDGTAQLIEQLEFIELYEDRAVSCLYSLSKLEEDVTNSYNIGIEKKRISMLPGSKQRIIEKTGEGWWNRITVIQSKEQDAHFKSLVFNASTGSAREEQSNLFSSTQVLDQLIEDISTNNKWTPTLAQTVFELLIPNAFKEQLKRQGNINWILDEDTAAYPWELLQDTTSRNAKPLCINSGMIRQMITNNFRNTVQSVAADNALVIGDPKLFGFLPQLPGAIKEGKIVEQTLKDHNFEVTTIINGINSVITEALFGNVYKIIHLAGHGSYNPEKPGETGMVIGQGIFLTSGTIAQMSSVPEFVFVNCCSLGKMQGTDNRFYQQRYKFAANIGTQLIQNGVKAVIAAGWAVSDAAALAFTDEFYKQMFAGETFGEAVKKSRAKVYEDFNDTNTWGAYQCYGDPFYRFRNNSRAGWSAGQRSYVISQEAEIDLSNLRNQLDMGSAKDENYLQQLATISEAVDKAGIRTARITEKEALIYADLFRYEDASEKFQELMQVEDASFSFSVMEKYLSVRSKMCYERRKDGFTADVLLKDIDFIHSQLGILLGLGQTAERYSLIGSNYKRKAMLQDDPAQKIEACQAAAYYYQKACGIESNTTLAYAYTNWIELEAVVNVAAARPWGTSVRYNEEDYTLPAIDLLQEQLNKLISKPGRKFDYWQMINNANVHCCNWILDACRDKQFTSHDTVFKNYNDVWKKAESKGKKMIVINHLEFLTNILSAAGIAKAEEVEKLRARLAELV